MYALSVSVPPGHTFPLLASAMTLGNGCTVTLTFLVVAQFLLFVMVTPYVVDVFGVADINDVVVWLASVHWYALVTVVGEYALYEVVSCAVSCMLSPLQITESPVILMEGILSIVIFFATFVVQATLL
jgi:hypothetical protein